MQSLSVSEFTSKKLGSSIAKAPVVLCVGHHRDDQITAFDSTLFLQLLCERSVHCNLLLFAPALREDLHGDKIVCALEIQPTVPTNHLPWLVLMENLHTSIERHHPNNIGNGCKYLISISWGSIEGLCQNLVYHISNASQLLGISAVLDNIDPNERHVGDERDCVSRDVEKVTHPILSIFTERWVRTFDEWLLPSSSSGHFQGDRGSAFSFRGLASHCQ